MIVGKIQEWGNAQGLRLPKQVLQMAGIAVGDDVEIVVARRQITVKKAQRKFNLAEVVARIPKGYKAKELHTGPAVGREEW